MGTDLLFFSLPDLYIVWLAESLFLVAVRGVRLAGT